MDDVDELLSNLEPPPGLADALAQLDADLRERRFTATSPDGVAQVTADGHSVLVNIVVQDQALRGPHRHVIGPAIVAAVAAAKHEAAVHTQSRLSDVLSGTEQQPPPAPSPRRRRAESLPDDEYADQFSVFEPKPGVGGRW